MDLRTVKCVNETCPHAQQEVEIASMVQVATGVGILFDPLCMACGWAMYQVDNRVATVRLTRWQAEHIARVLRIPEGMDPLDQHRVDDVVQQITQALERTT